MIIIKSCKNYKCLSFYIILFLCICNSSCSNKINDYLIKNIIYGKNKNDIKVDLEYDDSKTFNIKNYDNSPLLDESRNDDQLLKDIF